MKKRIALIILLIGILFPFAALMQFSSTYAKLFSMVFDSRLSHIIMHAALFAALSLCVMSMFPNITSLRQAQIAIAVVAVVGLSQETIQMLSVNARPTWDTLFDLGVDLTGGALPILFMYAVNRLRVVTRT